MLKPSVLVAVAVADHHPVEVARTLVRDSDPLEVNRTVAPTQLFGEAEATQVGAGGAASLCVARA